MGVELLFVARGAKPVGCAVVDGTRGVGRIDRHVANGAESARVGGSAQLCVFSVGVGVEPAASLIFEVECGFGRNRAAVVALDDAEREINARRKSARGSKVAVFDESGAPFDLHVGISKLKTGECSVMSGGALAGQQSGFSK